MHERRDAQRYHRRVMQWPEPAAAASPGTPPDPRGAAPVTVAADLAEAADRRFETVCDELGILPSRRVESVAARVLPFGTEQLAVVEVRTIGDGERLVD